MRSHAPLEQGALEALVAHLPGLVVVAPAATPPPAVLLWDPGPGRPEAVPDHHEVTAILLLAEDVTALPQPLPVAGLFSREEKPPSLGVAIRQVARGQEYLSPALALALLQRQQSSVANEAEGTAQKAEALTAREAEVLGLLGEGLSNKEIAARLYLSVRTVEGHLTNAYAKLDVHSRTEAALLAARLNG